MTNCITDLLGMSVVGPLEKKEYIKLTSKQLQSSLESADRPHLSLRGSFLSEDLRHAANEYTI